MRLQKIFSSKNILFKKYSLPDETAGARWDSDGGGGLMDSLGKPKVTDRQNPEDSRPADGFVKVTGGKKWKWKWAFAKQRVRMCSSFFCCFCMASPTLWRVAGWTSPEMEAIAALSSTLERTSPRRSALSWSKISRWRPTSSPFTMVATASWKQAWVSSFLCQRQHYGDGHRHQHRCRRQIWCFSNLERSHIKNMQRKKNAQWPSKQHWWDNHVSDIKINSFFGDV